MLIVDIQRSPGAMALAATASTELAQRVTFASASEMKMAGINWAYVLYCQQQISVPLSSNPTSYSPVADVNSDPRNPVIGVRSFGDGSSAIIQESRMKSSIHRARPFQSVGLRRSR